MSHVCCSVLQCVLQCVAVCVAVCCSVSWQNCTTLHHTTPHYTTLHHTAPHCTTLHHTTPHCTTLHHTAPHCTTLHHTAPHECLTHGCHVSDLQSRDWQSATESLIARHIIRLVNARHVSKTCYSSETHLFF